MYGDQQYYVLPGGGIEVGEDPKTAVKRELIEETMIVTEPRDIIAFYEARPGHNAQYLVECSYVSGDPALSKGSEEYKNSVAGINIFDPLWMPLSEARVKIVPEEFRQYV